MTKRTKTKTCKTEKPRPPRVAAIVLAAGSSLRMGGVKKEYLPFPGGAEGGTAEGESADSTLSVLGKSVLIFAEVPCVSMIVVVHPQSEETPEKATRALGDVPVRLRERKIKLYFTRGGKRRKDSVFNALSFLYSKKVDYVLIHDGARPWCGSTLARNVLFAAFLYGAAIPAVPLDESPKRVGEDGFIEEHIVRKRILRAQTPQGFEFEGLWEAYKKSNEYERKRWRSGREWTDDSEIYDEFRGKVFRVEGEAGNKKITYISDIPAFCRDARRRFEHN